MTEEASTLTAVISASPIIKADAVAAVRRGLREAFVLESTPMVPKRRRIGEPSRLARVDLERWAQGRVAPEQAQRDRRPRPPAHAAWAAWLSPTAINRRAARTRAGGSLMSRDLLARGDHDEITRRARALLAAGYSPERIRTERFGPTG